ncbi:MAG: Hint domain-containing protein [Alphaproteobacteria bacterium]|nr:Hint domain-containing protein [Alphaproteobacteria bacterium]
MAIIVVTDTTPQPIEVKNGDKVVIDIAGGGDVLIVAANPNVRRFTIEFEDDAQTDTAIVDLSTFQGADLHIDVRDYNETDTISLLGAQNGTIEPGNLDEYQFDYVGADGNTYSGFVRAKDVGERDLTTDPPPIIICFAAGTIIDTDLGPTPIEALSPGDLVVTQNNGLQPIRWIGSRRLDARELALAPTLRPIRIRAGALGADRPFRDLLVSPEHRIKLGDWRAELLFGEAEVLAAAKTLVDGTSVVVDPVESVTYYHLLFDGHEIVRSNGLLSESLHPGDMALMALDDAARDEITNLFADLPVDLTERPTARRVLRRYEARAARGYAA